VQRLCPAQALAGSLAYLQHLSSHRALLFATEDRCGRAQGHPGSFAALRPVTVTHLHLHDHRIQEILDAKTAAPLTKVHTLALDSVVAFEVHDFRAGIDEQKVLSDVAPSRDLLDHVEHMAVLTSTNGADALKSMTIGLGHPGGVSERSLQSCVSWSVGSPQPGVLGRIVELHMQPGDLMRLQNGSHDVT
jgi:hypothetical protein